MAGRTGRRRGQLIKCSVGLLLFVVLLWTTACTQGSGGSDPQSDTPVIAIRTDDRDVWPADPADVVVVASDTAIATLVDGGLVALDEMADADAAHTDIAGDVLAVNATGELLTVDLISGEVAHAFCAECSGIAVVGDRVVTIDKSFVMFVYRDDLSLEAVVPLPFEDEPENGEYGDWQTPTVVGALGDDVVVGYLTPEGGGRTGPSIVSLYSLRGRAGESWIVDGIVGPGRVDPTSRRIVIGVGGSGGACYSSSDPVVLEPGESEPLPLGEPPDASGEGALFWARDLWWNGDEVVAVGDESENGASGCALDAFMRRFDDQGEVGSDRVGDLTQYQFVGNCDRAVMTTESSGEPAIYLVDDAGKRLVEDFTTVLWAEQSNETCAVFPGIDP